MHFRIIIFWSISSTNWISATFIVSENRVFYIDFVTRLYESPESLDKI